MKFDQKDKIILESLFSDCRISLKELSRRSNLTHSAVLYRIRGYEKEGVIDKYDGILNFEKFDKPFTAVFVYVDDKRKREFEDFCLQEDGVISLFRCAHKYNYLVSAFLSEKQRRRLFGYLDELGFLYKSMDSKRVYSFVTRIFDDVDVPVVKQNFSGKKLDLDEVDVSLMKILFDGGGREPILELARKMDMSADLILYRFRRLVKNGYFSRFAAQPNPAKFNVKFEIISFEVKEDDFDYREFFENLGKCAFLFDMGKGKYLATLFVRDLRSLEVLFGKIYDGIGEKMKRFDFHIVRSYVFLNRISLDSFFE